MAANGIAKGSWWVSCSVGLLLLTACSGAQPPAATGEQTAANTATEQAATEQAATEQAATEQAATEQAATEQAATEQAATEPAATVSAASSKDGASARLQVPPGFTLNAYFSGLRAPRLMTVGPDGNLYVAEPGSGAVVRLPDANNDGVADERQVVADRLVSPHSVEWFEGALYVADAGRVLRMADQNGDGDFLDDGEQATVTDNIPTGGNHTSRTLHFGPDGKLYVAAGSSTNISVESDRRRATIMRFNPDGTI